jgi:hypothetical protein
VLAALRNGFGSSASPPSSASLGFRVGPVHCRCSRFSPFPYINGLEWSSPVIWN